MTAATLQVFHHARVGRVCVQRTLLTHRGPTWCFRSELTGGWMPCVSGHPINHVIDVPVDPTPAAAAVVDE